MRTSTHLRWIAQAEARSVWQQTTLQRAVSEPHVSIVYARTRLTWFDRVRGLLRARGRMTAATRSPSATGEDFDRVLVTVLITDIIDSTRRVAEIGDRAWLA